MDADNHSNPKNVAFQMLTNSLRSSNQWSGGPASPLLVDAVPKKNIKAGLPYGKLLGYASLAARGKTPVHSKSKTEGKHKINDQRMKDSKSTVSPVPTVEDCQLGNILRSARRCLTQLREVKDRMGQLVSQDDQLTHGVMKTDPGPDTQQLSHLAQNITVLTREAFIPAHRLNQTAICLHGTEDLLRNPNIMQGCDLSSATGRINLPTVSFNKSTITKFRLSVDQATDFYNKFNCRGPAVQMMQDILLSIMRAFQDLYVTAVGCFEIFKHLLYVDVQGKADLDDFVKRLSLVERSEMLNEVQDLRRTLDEVAISLEKLSWGSYTVYCLTNGKGISSVQPEPQFVPDPSIDTGATILPGTGIYHSSQKLKTTLAKKKTVSKKSDEVIETPKIKEGYSSKKLKIKTVGLEKKKKSNSKLAQK